MSDKTVEEMFLAAQEQKTNAFKSLLKERLGDNDRFSAMADNYRKAKRFLAEAKGLASDDKYEAKRAAIQERLDALEQKRTTAIEAESNLNAIIEAHESAQVSLANKLAEVLGNVSDIQDVNIDELVDNLLNDIEVDNFTNEVDDPFVNYRRAKKESE